MRYLVVDDSRAMLSIIKRGVQNAVGADKEVKTASSGEQALDIIRQWKPSLILTDWHMPGMSGMDLMHNIQREMLNIKVGFITTESSKDRIAAAKAAGALFVIQKPFSQDELAQAVVLASSSGAIQPPATEPSPINSTNTPQFVLPSAENFADLVNSLSRNEILVEPVDAVDINSKQLPCLVGLMDDGQSSTVRAVCVLELRAACILGAAIADIPSLQARQAISRQTINRPILNGCRRLLNALSKTLQNTQTGNNLQLRGVNIVPKIFPKLESIYEHSKRGRSDFEIAVLDYGQGLMTIITAQ